MNASEDNASCLSRVLNDPKLSWPHVASTGIVLFSISLLIVLGNFLILIAVAINPRLRSPTTVFIVNLAVADLLLAVAVLPFSSTWTATDTWLFGPTFCAIWSAIDVLCCTGSILSLCVISIDRYVGVTRPLKYPQVMTRKRCGLLVTGVWALSTLVSIAPIIGWREENPAAPCTCFVNDEASYAVFSALCSFYLPLVVILAVYSKIYSAAVRQSKFLASGQKTSSTVQRKDGVLREESVTLRVHTVRMRLEQCDSKNSFSGELLDFKSD